MGKTLKKIDIAKIIHKNCEFKMDTILEVLGLFDSILKEAIDRGYNVKMGHGTLQTYVRPPKSVYDFTNQCTTTLPSGLAVRFKPSASILRLLREKNIVEQNENEHFSSVTVDTEDDED